MEDQAASVVVERRPQRTRNFGERGPLPMTFGRQLTADGLLICVHCQELQKPECFNRDSGHPTGRYHTCKRCYNLVSTMKSIAIYAWNESRLVLSDDAYRRLRDRYHATTHCPIFGVLLVKGGGGTDDIPNRISVDAVIYARGHVEENLRFMSYRANRAKYNLNSSYIGRLEDATRAFAMGRPRIPEPPSSAELPCRVRPTTIEPNSKWCVGCQAVLPVTAFRQTRHGALEASCRQCLAITGMLNAAKRRARQRGVPCTITLHHIRWLAEQTEVCPIFLTRLQYGTSVQSDNSATLDRLDPKLGYTPENIWIISKRANVAKNDLDIPELGKLRTGVRALEEELGFFFPPWSPPPPPLVLPPTLL